MNTYHQLQEFKGEVQKRDRRNFEAFIFAKVTHEVLKSIPIFGEWFEKRFKAELDCFLGEHKS